MMSAFKKFISLYEEYGSISEKLIQSMYSEEMYLIKKLGIYLEY